MPAVAVIRVPSSVLDATPRDTTSTAAMPTSNTDRSWDVPVRRTRTIGPPRVTVNDVATAPAPSVMVVVAPRMVRKFDPG